MKQSLLCVHSRCVRFSCRLSEYPAFAGKAPTYKVYLVNQAENRANIESTCQRRLELQFRYGISSDHG